MLRKPFISKAWQNHLFVLLVIAGVFSGVATYAAFAESLPLISNDSNTVIWLLNLDFIILVLFLGLVAQRIVGLWSGRKRGLAGSHLHVKLVYTFSILAAAPAIIMTVFSAFFFHFGVQTWFSERVSSAINNSQAVAEAYLEEHKQVIRADTLAMASDLDRQATLLISNQALLNQIVKTQAYLRNFSEAVVFSGSGEIMSHAGSNTSLGFENIGEYNLKRTKAGEVVITTGANDDRVRALTRLANFPETYLYVGRQVEQKVLAHVASTRQASQDYADLESRYSDIQVAVLMIFVIIGLVLMMIGIWMGLLLARQLVRPISTLIKTADRVRAGDLSARVPDDQKSLEEFDYLAGSFNRMTKQIQEQQNDLIEANRQLDRRRRFTETVLAGVSSGVVGVDSKGTINLTNSSSHKLLAKSLPKAEGEKNKSLVGLNIKSLMPGIGDLLEKAHKTPQKITQGELPIQRIGDITRTYLVRIAIELIGEEDVGAIITFDDITALQSAQRKAAWSDVARRIAHEMKNPLTPIQLSAERLRRKYMDQIKDDPETFKQCTETIIKNVSDIGHMVNEFSSFARMPTPVMESGDLSEHIVETLSLHKQAHPEIKFRFSGRKKGEYIALFDAAQIRQVLNNLVQNAIDSVTDSGQKTPKIDLVLGRTSDDQIALVISDNGSGFPEGVAPEELTEPYITHKKRGTGLGLAIVKKILEDHQGSLNLTSPSWLADMKGWTDLGGANVVLLFPKHEIKNTMTDNDKKAVNA